MGVGGSSWVWPLASDGGALHTQEDGSSGTGRSLLRFLSYAAAFGGDQRSAGLPLAAPSSDGGKGAPLPAAEALAHGDGSCCCNCCAAALLGSPAPATGLGSCTLRCAAPAAASLRGLHSPLRLLGGSGGRLLPGAPGDLGCGNALLWVRESGAPLWLQAIASAALGMGSSTVEAGEILVASPLPTRTAASLGCRDAAAEAAALLVAGGRPTSWLPRRTGVEPPGGGGAGASVSSCTSSAAVGRTFGSASRHRRMMPSTSSGHSSGTLWPGMQRSEIDGRLFLSRGCGQQPGQPGKRQEIRSLGGRGSRVGGPLHVDMSAPLQPAPQHSRSPADGCKVCHKLTSALAAGRVQAACRCKSPCSSSGGVAR